MALYRKGAGQGLLFIGGSLAHNANCCCSPSENKYAFCYCPNANVVCVDNLTMEEGLALEIYPEVIPHSQNKECSDPDANTFRCVGRTSTSSFPECPDECAAAGSIIFTSGSQSYDPATLNCNQYLPDPTTIRGFCQVFESDGVTFIESHCNVTDAFCEQFVEGGFDGTTVVWTEGSCLDIATVEIQEVTTERIISDHCTDTDYCCDHEQCGNGGGPPARLCTCCTFQIVETSAPLVYQSGNLCDLPATWTPPTPIIYTGYMELRINGQVVESWTVQNGVPTRTFANYKSDCIDCTENVGEIEYGEK